MLDIKIERPGALFRDPRCFRCRDHLWSGTRLAVSGRVQVLADRQETGKQGEDLAVQELERRGCVILARRYRTRFGEIDIVAEEGDEVIFVEVKARRSTAFGSAAEAVPSWKQRRIAAMALDYLAFADRLNDPCRFDVVAIDGIGTSHVEVRVIEDAFPAHGT